jgi:hypothetical protein
VVVVVVVVDCVDLPLPLEKTFWSDDFVEMLFWNERDDLPLP